MTQTRRQFLTALAGATAAGTVARGASGASADSGYASSSTVQTGDAWPMFSADPQNTGYSDGTGPQSDVGPAWEFETDDEVVGGATVTDDTVYVGSRDGNVYAIDAESGSETWRFETGSEVQSTPAVVDGTVYVGAQDGVVYALDTGGEELWRFGTGDAVTSSPAVVDDTVYVGSRDNSVYAIDAAEGTERWQFETEFWVESSPAVADGVVYVGSNDQSVYAIDAESGEELWSFETTDTVPGSPTVVDDTVYIGGLDQFVYALDTEGEGKWTFETDGAITSSPAVADETVYVGSRDGYVYALDGGTGDEQWSVDTGRQVSASPAVADGVVYVASESDTVFGFDVETGEERWSVDTGRPVAAPPAVADGAVYVGNASGTLYALEEGHGDVSIGGSGDGSADGSDASSTDGPGESGGTSDSFLPDLRFLLLPATAIGAATAIVGGYYLLHRAGAFDEIQSATERFGEPDESVVSADDSDGGAGDRSSTPADGQDEPTGAVPSKSSASGRPSQSQLWQLVVEDVTERAAETEKTAIDDVIVTKHLDRETLSAPVLVYEITSLRDDPVGIRLTEPVVETDSDAQPMGDNWRLDGTELVYETVLDPEETVTTLVGRPDCPAEHAGELLDKPTLTVETQ